MTDLYTCRNCNYTFQSDEEPNQVLHDHCPDCGKIEVRLATEAEADAFRSIQAELTAQ